MQKLGISQSIPPEIRKPQVLYQAACTKVHRMCLGLILRHLVRLDLPGYIQEMSPRVAPQPILKP